MNRHIKPLAASVLLFLFIMAGCSKERPLTTEELSGVYTVTYSHGKETLELKRDGTYDQRYTGNVIGQTFANQGRWKIDDKFGAVTLIDAVIVDTGFDKLRTPPDRGAWSLNIIRGSPLALSMNPDRALMFEKQK